MAKPVAEHPDYGCHHELHTADGTVLHACDLYFMQPVAVAVADPPDPPTDLLVRAEQKRRADAAARRAQKRNRQAGAK